jgi:hypothetical protein
MEKPISKPIGLLLMLIVVFIVVSTIKLYDNTESGINLIKEKAGKVSDIYNDEKNFSSFKLGGENSLSEEEYDLIKEDLENCDKRNICDTIKNCDNNNYCSETEKNKWQSFKKYLGYIDCSVNFCSNSLIEIWIESGGKREDVKKLQNVVLNEEEKKKLNLLKKSIDDSGNDKLKKTYENLNNYNLLNYLIKESLKENVDLYLVYSVLAQESVGNPFAVSKSGCVGLFQFCYDTAYSDEFKDIFKSGKRVKCLEEPSECVKDARMNPYQSIDAGVKYLKKLLKNYNGDLKLVLTAYNAGSAISNKCRDINDENKKLDCILESTYNYYSERENENIDPNNKKKEVKKYIASIEGMMSDLV